MPSGPITSWQTDGEKMERVTDFIFLSSKITMDSVCSHEIKKHLLLGRKAITNLESVFKHCFANKGLDSQSYGFSSSHVWMWTLDHKEGWAPKNWCFQIVVLEKTLESPLDSTEIKSVNPKGNQPWICIRRTDAWSSNTLATRCKQTTQWKNPDAEKYWWHEKKGATGDEMVGYLGRLWEIVGDRDVWHPAIVGLQRVGHNLATEQQKQQ